ncbi:hypothetical protein D3C85_1296780 [compost metagenome]
MAISQLTDGGQHRDFEQHAVQHWATNTDSQLTLFIRHMDIAQVEAEQPQETLEIRGQVFTEAGVENEP